MTGRSACSDEDLLVVARRLMALHEDEAGKVARQRARHAKKVANRPMAEFWADVGEMIRRMNREMARHRSIVLPPAFEATPHPYLLLYSDLTIIGVNDAYLAVTMTNRGELLGRALFDAFPDNPDHPEANGVANATASMTRVLDTGRTDYMSAQRYDIRRPDGVFCERWWRPINIPVFVKPGKLTAILHHAEDITPLRY